MQNNDFFTLLPTRHPPVEEPYSVSFLDLTPLSNLEDASSGFSECLLRVHSDGSANNNRRGQPGTGGGAVVVLPPYSEVVDAVVCHFQVPKPCTNIQAELQAAAQALRMIRQIRSQHPHIPIQYCTDSQYVLQILEGSFQGTHYASVTNEIICLWSSLCISVEACHVRAHTGILLNDIADRFAKKGSVLSHNRKVFHTLNFGQATISSVPTCSSFLAWL